MGCEAAPPPTETEYAKDTARFTTAAATAGGRIVVYKDASDYERAATLFGSGPGRRLLTFPDRHALVLLSAGVSEADVDKMKSAL
jgi:hypothetical protein